MDKSVNVLAQEKIDLEIRLQAIPAVILATLFLYMAFYGWDKIFCWLNWSKI